jgi:transcription elongation GreA/GreB family factor
MSRAFVKADDEREGVEELPDRLISPHQNLVTAEGLAQIEAAVARVTAEFARAQAEGDRNAQKKAARDLRYWSARLANADVVSPPAHPTEVQFGVTVTIRRDGGREQTFRIVGEDEADPASGTLSFVSPLAEALAGKSVGDVVLVGSGNAEVLEIKSR